MVVTQDDMIVLVKDAQAGNIEAFDILMSNYEREIFRYLIGLLGDREEALDFVQQVFLKAWLNVANLKDPARFNIWLYKIARNLVRDHWRCRKTRYQSWEDMESDKTTYGSPGPENCTEKAELITLALAEVTSKYRQCLLLKEVVGLPDSEIAAKVGISEASISTYICSARKQFRTAYQRLMDEQQK
jgi:RNA polymerase sigma-70 factor (ECF subfamily)